MSFDLSRVTFNSWNDFLGAVMLQGRPQLDSDWNDQQAEVLRRIQVGTMDAIGEAVYPAALPNSFLITVSAAAPNQLLIGAGRMYVDGILVENHGPSAVSPQGDPIPTASAAWDTTLAELSNSTPAATYASGAVDYTLQPYFPPGLALPSGSNGPFLAYLDVWQRPVTYIEHPDLVEKAVGVDTTGRLQTVWQVRLLDVSGNATAVDCSTPLGSIAAWGPATASSAGGLTSNVVQTTPSGPCCLTPNTGYTGMENQLYRVEIHVGGGLGTATFKWSKDNASVMTGVTAITTVTNTAKVSASQLTVQSMGRDEVLGFQVGDWIEVLDDTQDLNCEAGFLHMIDSVNIAAKTITLDSPLDTAAYTFPVDANNNTTPALHTRIRRWDQSGLVQDTNGNTVANVGLAGGRGDIPITDATTVIVLENGVTVQFNLNPSNGVFLPGDYWNFAARASDGSVELITQAPPLGIHHHYARLAMVTFPGVANDCRTPWPKPGASSSGCGCTVTIGPGDVTASNTLQQVIDQFTKLTTETVICMLPGTYTLEAPLRLDGDYPNITLSACQAGTVVLAAGQGNEEQFGDGMVILNGTDSFTLSGIVFRIPTTTYRGETFAGLTEAQLRQYYAEVVEGAERMKVAIGVRPINCDSLTIEECQFGGTELYVAGSDPSGLAQGVVTTDEAMQEVKQGVSLFGAAVFAAGTCSNLRMADNQVDGMFAGFLIAPMVSLKVSAKKGTTIPKQGVTIPSGTFVTTDKARELMVDASGRTGETYIPQVPVSDTGLKAPTYGGFFNQPTDLVNLVADGGRVVPSSLTDAVFDGNTFEDLTVAVLVLGETGAVQFTGNRVEGCAAGLWIVAPSMASMLLFNSDDRLMGALLVAMSFAPPKDEILAEVAVPAAPEARRFYTGKEPYKDSEGNTWEPEANTTGLTVGGGGEIREGGAVILRQIQDADPDQPDPELYANERTGAFTYTLANLVPGFYQVTLKFAEIDLSDATKETRVFGVSINGTLLLSQFNIAVDAGGLFTSDDQVFSNVVPKDGKITIAFADGTGGTTDRAKIAAVEIEPQWDGLIANPYMSVATYGSYYTGEVVQFYTQLAQMGQEGFARLAAATLDLRLDDNEMTGLSAPGFLVLAEDQLINGIVSSMMMSGNRVKSSISLPEGGYDDPSSYFLSAASVLLVTRCVVSGNMVLNEGSGATLNLNKAGEPAYSFPLYPFSLILNKSPGRTATDMPAKLPKVCVSGNVFEGQTVIYPPRYPAGGAVPAPMNDWDFLNTVTL